MIYDENQGIIFVEKDASGKPIIPKVTEKKEKTIIETTTVTRTIKRSAPEPLLRTTKSTDLHVGRKKDPVELYFQSGLEYFRSKDFENALKNFSFADSVDPKPEYSLWIGKCLRQLGAYDKMLLRMQQILAVYPQSEVADDALFEIAFYYQTIDDYARARALYSQLAEQYPFGESYSNHEAFIEIAKEQKRIMRADAVSMLKTLDIQGKNAEELYTAFQKQNNLQISGIGDQTTIRLLKSRYDEFLKRQEQKALQAERLQRYRQTAVVTAGIVLCLCMAMLVAFVQIKQKSRRVLGLKQTLESLDSAAL